jgi:hypothetical protein
VKTVLGKSLRLCAALAALMLPLFPGCLNPRPEEDPQDISAPPGSTGSAGSGAGVLEPPGNNDSPSPGDEGSSPSSPPPGERDAGVPDGGGLPDGGGCDPGSDAEDTPDAGSVGDAAPPGVPG